MSILEKDMRDPLCGMQPDEFIQKLCTILRGRVESAWLFGSFGSPAFGPQSDIDLILITPTKTPFVRRGEAFFDLLDIGPRIDILVYTPEEFSKLTSKPSPGFWQSVVPTLRRVI